MSREYLIFPAKFPRFPDSRQNLQIPGINLFSPKTALVQSCHPPSDNGHLQQIKAKKLHFGRCARVSDRQNSVFFKQGAILLSGAWQDIADSGAAEQGEKWEG